MKPDAFQERNREFIARMRRDGEMQHLSRQWFAEASKLEYSYHFSWLGLPVIQYPQDLVAMQEIIWAVKPDLIVETGIARGGSLVFYASMLELIGYGEVLGIDIDIRQYNRRAIESHPMCHRISMIEGSSTENEVIEQVCQRTDGKESVLVILDSNHTHDHVLRELELYAPLVTPDNYLVVMDTVIEEMPEGFFEDRPWSRGNNPMTAVRTFLEGTDEFVVDATIHDKLAITVAPSGYLKRIKPFD